MSKLERIDDLQCNGLRLVQDTNLYNFTIDAVLLVNLSKVKQNGVVVDLCSGSGIIPILVAGKSKAKKVYAIELQKELYCLAQKSILLNNLESKIEIFNDDIKNYKNHLSKNCADVVYCNPPYSKPNNSIIGENTSRNIARQEITITLKEVVKVASELLKDKGCFYMVHQAKRLQEILFEFANYNLAVKEVTICQSKQGAKPHLVIIKAVKGGKFDLIVNTPLVLNNEDGTLTNEVFALYSKTMI